MAKTKQRHETPKFERSLLQGAQKMLNTLAEKEKMNQSEIAKKLGWAPQHVFRGLKEGVPSLRVAVGIAKALGYQVEISFTKKGSKTKSSSKGSKPKAKKASKPAAPKAETKTEAAAPPAQA